MVAEMDSLTSSNLNLVKKRSTLPLCNYTQAHYILWDYIFSPDYFQISNLIDMANISAQNCNHTEKSGYIQSLYIM